MYMLYCLFFRNLVDVYVVVYDVYVLFFNVYVVGKMLIDLFLLKSIMNFVIVNVLIYLLFSG